MTNDSSLTDEQVFHKIFTCDGVYSLEQREFAAEFVRSDSQEIFMRRSLRFVSMDNLWEFIRIQRPLAVHVGAVMLPNTDLVRELVFDLDVTDKKAFCACDCATKSPPTACEQCWCFIQIGAHCLNESLRYLFGRATTPYWWYSGNRGVHGYLSNERVFTLSRLDRENLVSLLSHDRRHPYSAFQLTLRESLQTFYTQQLYPRHFEKLNTLGITHTPTQDQLMDVCWPQLDTRVTGDLKHLIRCPGTVNPKTGVLVTRIRTDSLLEFVPERFRTQKVDE